MTDTYTRPDHSTYSTTERSHTQRWPISEHTEVRHQSKRESLTDVGPRHWLTRRSTKTYTIFHQMSTYKKRIATKPDGSVHVIKDWWHANTFEVQRGQRTVRTWFRLELQQ